MLRLFLILLLAWPFVAGARPAALPSRPDLGGPPLIGAVPGLAKAAGDSFLVMGPWGSGAPYVGNFETGTWGDPAWHGWTGVDLSGGVGNFARIWQQLQDLDPCVSNYTPQVAFLDDGTVVPGTGGSMCVNWCYGPNGYIVNTTGGLAGPDHYLRNAVRSPVLVWPDQAMNGATLAYTALLHEDLSSDAPGMLHFWEVRSTASGDPEDLESAPWRSNQVYTYDWGGEYHRETWVLTTLLEPGRTHLQVQVGVQETGWAWGYDGNDGYPAPYFDNIRLLAWETGGPHLTAQDRYLAQDAFPEHGIIEHMAHGANHVRFDMAANISPDGPLHNDPGDSLVFDAAPARSGAVLAAAPRLHYRLQRNPVFDAWRTAGLPDLGWVAADSVIGSQGAIANRWCVDLPDSGFLFPGDVLRYYLEASDDVGGDVRTAILPADTTGFSAVGDPWAYDPRFTMRALPSLELGPGNLLRPALSTLVWFDSGRENLDSLWRSALAANHLEPGRDIDLFRTVSPGSGLGNGLGGRATPAHLAGYADLVYTAGDVSWNSLAQRDDPNGDVQLLDTWLSFGGRAAFMAGDNLASSLSGTGFLAEWMGLGVVGSSLRPLIDNQVAPRVVAEAGGPLELTGSWIAFGGCLFINTFDAVQPLANAQRLARFTDPSGQIGSYTYAAATLATDPLSGSRVLSLPYDLGFVYSDPEAFYRPGGTNARISLLRDVGIRLEFIAPVSAVPDAGTVAAFGTRHWPNPFNPRVTIECAIARPGRLTVKVFDVRGRLVRTVLDEHVDQGATLSWDGRDDQGAQAASGTYFYEARMHGEVQVGRMLLVK